MQARVETTLSKSNTGCAQLNQDSGRTIACTSVLLCCSPAEGSWLCVHLKVHIKFNRIRSAIATLKDEILYQIPTPKFDRPVLVNNVNRINRFLSKGSTISKINQAYTDPTRTVNYFVFYMILAYYFQVPTNILYYLCKKYSTRQKNIVAYSTSLVKNEMMEEDAGECTPLVPIIYTQEHVMVSPGVYERDFAGKFPVLSLKDTSVLCTM